MNFSTIKALTIPEGVVTKIERADGTILWSSAPASRLPAEYQEVEYLFADRNVKAYIDLGFAYDTAATVELGQYIYDDTSTYIFGAAENSGVLRCMFSSPYSGSMTAYGSNGNAFIQQTTPYTLSEYNNIKSVYKSGSWKTYNYTNGSIAGPFTTLANYTMTNNLYLFGQNYNGTPRYGGMRRINFFKYYDKDDVLICELVPCYRKIDSMPGMYDVVRKIFLTNALNNGIIFIAGPNVRDDSYKPTFTNLIDSAVGDDGEIYNRFGYADGMRWSLSGNAEVEHNVGRLSGWMPYVNGATYRFKNFNIQYEPSYANGVYVIYKKADGTISVDTTGKVSNNTYSIDVDNDVCTFVARYSDVVSFRISGYISASPIVTKNEVIIL